MIEIYVNKLIDNLPEIKYEKIDLILDGGLFNGSYLVGAIYFLKEMENRDYLKIERISGCSIGSLIGFLYYINSLDSIYDLYNILKNDLKKNFNLNCLKNIKTYLGNKIPENICEKINGKLFICYNNIKKNKKIVKSQYKNVDEIIQTIIKSCYIPFFIDGKFLYKNQFMDGINAHIFERNKNRILHLELFGLDKIFASFNIKNENTNFHRILSGMLDIHYFFIKKTDTYMCSYVNDWNVINYTKYYLKILFEIIVVKIMSSLNYFENIVDVKLRENILTKIIHKIISDVFIILFDNYCI